MKIKTTNVEYQRIARTDKIPGIIVSWSENPLQITYYNILERPLDTCTAITIYTTNLEHLELLPTAFLIILTSASLAINSCSDAKHRHQADLDIWLLYCQCHVNINKTKSQEDERIFSNF